MSIEKFTPGEWFFGNPFRYKVSMSEWCNVYADGERTPIAVVLLNDGCGTVYNNAALIAAAPTMYDLLNSLLNDKVYSLDQQTRENIEYELKKARGEE